MATSTLDHLLRLAEGAAKADPDIARRLRLWAADCVARVLPLYERAAPGDARPRAAIVAARQHARGEVGADALRSFGAASGRAASASWGISRAAAAAVAQAADDACGDAVELIRAVRDAAWAAGFAAADAKGKETRGHDVWRATQSAAHAVEEAWQLDRLCAWIAGPEPADWPLDAPPSP